MENLKRVVDFFYEAGMVSKTPRSYTYFLGSDDKSVADHLFRCTIIGYSLAKLDGTVNVERVILMSMFSDFSEARISDLNWIHQKYNQRNEEKAEEDFTSGLPFENDIRALLHEYKVRESKESILAKEADHLEFLISLKEQADIGNQRAKGWIEISLKRLKTDIGKQMAQQIIETDSSDWWFDKESTWWVNRNEPNE